MERNRFASRACRSRHAESGQVNIFLLLAMGIFFLAFIGLAVDYSNFWFHRRMAQGAADAACQAGAMDMLVNATTGSNLGAFPSPAASFDCASNKTSAPCQYAALNGYPSSVLTSGTPGTDVQVSFPGSVSGVTTPPVDLAPTPFIQVNVQDRVQTFFSGLLTGKSTQDVGASAVCGLQQARTPIPIIVLNPTCSHAFQVSGSATLKIVGGPTKSVEVNSGNTSCAAATVSSANSCDGNGTIDLSAGGPSFSGSTFGVFGAPGTAPPNFIAGTTGLWQSPSPPIGDPFASVPAPDPPIAAPLPKSVAYGTDGCPDHSANCIEYFPGLYQAPIVISKQTAIFVPGVYYIKPTSYASASSGGFCGSPGSGCIAKPTGQCQADIVFGSNSIARPSSLPGDGSGGVMFYLSGPGGTTGFGSVVFLSDSGTTGGRNVDNFPSTGLTCDGSNPDKSGKGSLGIPSSVSGNVLLAQCTAGGTYKGPPSTDTIPGNLANATRGLLFFQDRFNNSPNAQPNMQGGGGLAISGTIYAHNCTASPCASTDYQAFVQLQGTPGSGTFVIGEIVADQLVEAGNGAIAMQLNPNSVLFVLKAELLQ